MRWPLVWRSTLEREDREWLKLVGEDRERWAGYERRAQELTRQAIDLVKQRDAQYADLLAKYHALRVSGANAPEPEKIIPPPKRPPAIVYRAMRAISPRDDATFAANWRLWEENQEECEKDPTAFAERIKRGRMTSEQPRAD